MKLPAPSPNPRYAEFRAVLATHPAWLVQWSGCFFRFQTIQFPSAKANDRYYVIETKPPRLVVAIQAKVAHILDLTSPGIRRQLGITLAELYGEDWRKLLQSGQESLSQALGRAAASPGASGLLVRSAAVHQARNVILFPPLSSSDRLSIIEGDALARLTAGKKP